MSLYVFPLFFSFILSIASLGMFILLEKYLYLPRRIRQELGRESSNISRWGGSIVVAVFVGTLFFDPSLQITKDVWGLILGCLGMLLLGFWDDVRPVGWRTQLLIQVVIVLTVVFIFEISILNIPNPFGDRIILEGEWGLFFGSVFAGMWFLLLMNALNWSDGVDGIAPGIVVMAALAFFALSLRPEVFQPPVAIISLALAGAYLGLFLFNMHPAKIFTGTAGVFVAGFTIAYLSIFAGAKIATGFLVLGLPVLDAFWVMWQRNRAGVPLASPDKRHLHHILLMRGWSKRRVSFFILGFVSIFALSTFMSDTIGKVVAIVILVLTYFLFMNNKS